MLKFYIFFALVAISTAAQRKVTLESGYITQGKNTSDVIVKQNNANQEIMWQEQFDNENSIGVHFMQIHEDTGLVETTFLDNLCEKYERDSLKNAIKTFILNKLAKTNRCPIKKRNAKVSYPITHNYSSKTKSIRCGPIIATLNIVRNNQEGSEQSPLLIHAWFRGFISGDDC